MTPTMVTGMAPATVTGTAPATATGTAPATATGTAPATATGMAPATATGTAPATATGTAPAMATGMAPATVTAAAPAMVTGNSAPTRSFGEMIEDLAPDIAAEFIGMRGEYPTWFVYTSLILSLAQLVVMKQQLRAAKAQGISIPAGSGCTSTRIERPRNLGNLQEAIGLENDNHVYCGFIVSFLFLLAKHTVADSCIL